LTPLVLQYCFSERPMLPDPIPASFSISLLPFEVLSIFLRLCLPLIILNFASSSLFLGPPLSPYPFTPQRFVSESPKYAFTSLFFLSLPLFFPFHWFPPSTDSFRQRVFCAFESHDAPSCPAIISPPLFKALHLPLSLLIERIF